ncbi:MAG: (d)CMP kinase [Planctomycetes bacterium]|nr:(d)CMP kinase [Planctomycetota bacterium]
MTYIIAIDGPAGAGKSTVARLVAQRLGWRFLDTGALYRALSLAAVEQGVAAENGPALASLASGLDLRQDADGRTTIGTRDVSDAIRTERITSFASRSSAQPEVRAALLELQRSASKNADLVCEGRDMGSVVFPNATLKVFLDADPQVRSIRRAAELECKGVAMDIAAVRSGLQQRDTADATRSIAPLQRVQDQVAIDTTGLTIAQVVDHILELIAKRIREGSVRT